MSETVTERFMTRFLVVKFCEFCLGVRVKITVGYVTTYLLHCDHDTLCLYKCCTSLAFFSSCDQIRIQKENVDENFKNGALKCFENFTKFMRTFNREIFTAGL